MTGSFVGPGGRLSFMLLIFLVYNKKKMGMNRTKKRNRRVDIVFFFSFSFPYVVYLCVLFGNRETESIHISYANQCMMHQTKLLQQT